LTDPSEPAPDPADPTPPNLPVPADPQTLAATDPAQSSVSGPPAHSMFSLEGRSAPALFLIGRLGSLLGLAIIGVSVMAAGTAAAPWLFLAGLAVLAIGVLSAGGSQALDRSHQPDLPYRGASPVIAFIAVIALTLLAIVVVLVPLSAVGLDPSSPLATTISLAITALMYVAVVRLLVVGPGALSWADMGLRLPASAAVRDLLLGAVFALPVLLVTLVFGGLLSRFIEPTPSPLPESGTIGGLLANLVSAAILAPIGEELFFRGFATTAWARAIGPTAAIVRGAAFFAFAHIVTQLDASFAEGAQRAAFSFLALLPIGLALGWVFLTRRSLYASIGMHAAFNALQVLALYAATQVPTS